MNKTRLVARLALVLALMAPGTSQSQTVWRVPTTIGYGSLGTAVGLLAVAGTGYDLDELGTIAVVTGAGALFGIVGGYKVGHDADVRLARGETLSSGHRNAIRLGVVLSVATVGAAVSLSQPIPIVRRDGSDIQAYSSQTALLRGAAVGAIGGALLQWALDGYLGPRTRISVGRTSSGTVTLGFTIGQGPKAR